MHQRMIGRAMLGLLAAIGLSSAAEAQGDLAERGRIIADTYCSECHATGEAGASPNTDAPPMRSFKESWPVESLAEALAEGIMVGHPDMPEIAMTTSEIDAFLAFLESF